MKGNMKESQKGKSHQVWQCYQLNRVPREGYLQKLPARNKDLQILQVSWRNVAMNQNPVPPVNIPIPTKIGSKMGGAPTNQNGIPLVLTHSHTTDPTCPLWCSEKKLVRRKKTIQIQYHRSNMPCPALSGAQNSFTVPEKYVCTSYHRF